ncbi:phospholipase D family protein [Agrobacterium sp. Ap1]|uniref:phospholipase D family protein n=1 Tax=Agrobacterium sp. Ap1 TaxID=2815337 RepID=UPI001A8F1324|nr:phospholipase D family protein [Agrobacterium sp. Ap1]MBO0145091.1 phospholipase D family protein [Agrobacterium sp. Ap1]
MTFGRDEDRKSILGALKPTGDQTVSRAIIATYSLDLVAMLGLVLSMGGDPEAEFENSPLGLVKAFERMRGRLVVLHQLGRIVAPSKHRSILPLLDTMVRAIESNEQSASWHPKLALVRYEAPRLVEWRFWIGSRNLTGSTDLDAGLLLVSTRERAARPIPDIVSLAEDLLKEAQVTQSELEELKAARWLTPPGISVRNILWRRHGQMQSFLPKAMIPRAERACAVSPFIDRGGLDEVLKAGSSHVTLLTTELAGMDYAPHDKVKFLVDTPPDPTAAVSVEQQQAGATGEFGEPASTGIHAKLLVVSKGDRTAALLGSANLTRRGLVGPNAEAVALLDIADEALVASLYAFVDAGLDLVAAEPDASAAEQERAKRELDGLISRFLEARLSLRSDKDGLHLDLGDSVNHIMTLARFEASAFLEDEAWVSIGAGARSLRLLARPPVLSEQTSLVTFRATSNGEPRVSRTWIQALEIDGLDVERRDRALLARYVGANRFRDWLKSLLDGIDATGGRRWTDTQREPGSRDPINHFGQIFTLETVLASWARDPSAFEARVVGMMSMLTSFAEVFHTIPDEREREAALNDLEEVRPFLTAINDAIGKPT